MTDNAKGQPPDREKHLAQSWDHNGWRRESTRSEQRDELILHIEEVEDRLADWQMQGGVQQRGERYDLESYLARLEKHLARLESYLGLDLTDDDASFVQIKPRMEG